MGKAMQIGGMARSDADIVCGKEELDWSRIQDFGIQSESYKLVVFVLLESRVVVVFALSNIRHQQLRRLGGYKIE